jgi:hypothetical protein
MIRRCNSLSNSQSFRNNLVLTKWTFKINENEFTLVPTREVCYSKLFRMLTWNSVFRFQGGLSSSTWHKFCRGFNWSINLSKGNHWGI